MPSKSPRFASGVICGEADRGGLTTDSRSFPVCILLATGYFSRQLRRYVRSILASRSLQDYRRYCRWHSEARPPYGSRPTCPPVFAAPAFSCRPTISAISYRDYLIIFNCQSYRARGVWLGPTSSYYLSSLSRSHGNFEKYANERSDDSASSSRYLRIISSSRNKGNKRKIHCAVADESLDTSRCKYLSAIVQPGKNEKKKRLCFKSLRCSCTIARHEPDYERDTNHGRRAILVRLFRHSSLIICLGMVE